MENYFSYNKIQLITGFSDIFFGDLTAEIIADRTNVYMSKLLIKQWMIQNGGASAAAIRQTANAFADYLLSFVVASGEE